MLYTVITSDFGIVKQLLANSVPPNNSVPRLQTNFVDERLKVCSTGAAVST